MSKVLRLILVWTLGAAVYLWLQLSYQVVEWVGLLAAGLLLGFAVLLSWSANRLDVRRPSGILKLALVSLVAGLMISQGLDVVYSANALPAGGRLDLLFEVAYFALQVAPVAYLAGRLWPWSKPEIEA